MRLVLSFTLLCAASLPLLAAPDPATTRPVTAQETASFDAFLQSRIAGQPPATPNLTPTLTATRQGKRWLLTASVDSAPRRGLPPLCKMTRSNFVHDANAPQQARWSEPAPAQQYAWFERGPVCGAPREPLRLLHPLPDQDVIALVNQQAALLQSARLLMAGNTSCARQRALNFKLAALDVGAGTTAGLFGLIMQSDRNSTAQVWVKRYGNGFTAWNVVCPAA